MYIAVEQNQTAGAKRTKRLLDGLSDLVGGSFDSSGLAMVKTTVGID